MSAKPLPDHSPREVRDRCLTVKIKNIFYESNRISEEQHNRYLNYVRANRAAEMDEVDAAQSGEQSQPGNSNGVASNGHDADHEADAQ